jgi:hypothetical protein
MLPSEMCPGQCLIILGDLNARVRSDHETWERVIGKNGVGICNSNVSFSCVHAALMTPPSPTHCSNYQSDRRYHGYIQCPNIGISLTTLLPGGLIERMCG